MFNSVAKPDIKTSRLPRKPHSFTQNDKVQSVTKDKPNNNNLNHNGAKNIDTNTIGKMSICTMPNDKPINGDDRIVFILLPCPIILTLTAIIETHGSVY